MKKLLSIFTVTIILTFLSCEADMGGFLLSPERFSDDIVINSIEDGSLLTVDDVLPVEIITTREELVVDRVLIEFYDGNGSLLGRSQVPGDTTDILNFPSIEIPDVDPGYYWVNISLIQDGESRKDKTIHFFISQEEFLMPDVISYPIETAPESYTLFDVDFIEDKGFDPYIRWSINNSVLQEGSLIDDGGRFQWKTPVYEGVYAIKLEVFPFSPGEALDGYNFTSPYKVVSEVYVSEIESVRDDELGDEEDFISLFHFRGNFKDSGTRDAASQVVGGLYPDVRDGVFGFHFGVNSGLIIEDNVLPLNNGIVQDFTVTGRISLDYNGSGRIFTAEDSGKSFMLTLFIDSNNTFAAEIVYNREKLYFDSGYSITQSGRFVEFAFSYEKNKESSDFVWVIDGEEFSRIFAPDAPFYMEPGGRSVIGAIDGFKGIIDEFGVKGVSDEKSAAFPVVIEEEVPELVIVEEEYLQEFNESEKGILSITPDSNISLPGLSLLGDKSAFELLWASELGLPEERGDETGYLAVSLNDTEIFEVYRQGDVVLLIETDSETADIKMADSDTVTFSLIRDSRGLWLFIGGEWINLVIESTGDNKNELIIGLRFINPENNTLQLGVNRLYVKSNYSDPDSDELGDVLLLKALSFADSEDENQTEVIDENSSESLGTEEELELDLSGYEEDIIDTPLVEVLTAAGFGDENETETADLESENNSTVESTEEEKSDHSDETVPVLPENDLDSAEFDAPPSVEIIN